MLLPATAQAAPLTTLKVRDCRTGDAPHGRAATFFAQMHAVPGTQRMAMRFTAYQRVAGKGLQSIPSAGLEPWRRSRPGVGTYGYTQTVTDLKAGGVYVMGVDYRWLDGSGHAVQTRHRVSGTCRQDGPLPNLAITGLSARPGDSPGTEQYAIDVANEGVAPANAVTVDIFVDSAQADTATVDEIDPGQTVTVHITGPACSQRVRAVVDRRALISETTDGDNVVRAGCPAAGP